MSHHSIVARLLPPPWHSLGNKILAGTVPVGFIVAPNAAFVAKAIADAMNKLMGHETQTPDELRIEELEAELSDAETKIEELQEKLDDIQGGPCGRCGA